MKRSRRRVESAAAIAGLAALMAWLGMREVDAGGRPLVELYDADPGTFDLQATSSPVAEAIARHVFEPLFYEGEGGRIHGLLAEDAYSTSNDGLTVVARLRDGIRFHDGRPLDAEAVAASFARLQGLGRSPLAEDLRGVIVAPGADPGTVTFQLPRPDFEFVPLVLANPYAGIVREREIAKGAVTAPEDASNRTGVGLAGTGPYRFLADAYEPKSSLTLGRFDAYRWPPQHFTNRGPARIPRLEFRFMPDRAARLAALLRADACVLSLSREHVALVRDRTDLRRHETFGGVTYLGFNLQRTRWQDPRLRRAVAMAVDKAELAATGPYTVALTPLTPSARGFEATVAADGYRFDPAQSRQLLAGLGPDAVKEVVLLAPEGSTYGALVDVLVPMLRQVGLAEVNVRRVAREEISTMRQDFDLLLYDYAWGDYTALGIFLGPGPRNLLGYGDPRVHDLVDQALATRDPVERQRHVAGAQRIVLQDALWQPLVIPRLTLAVSAACVDGERQAPDGTLEWHDAVTSGGAGPIRRRSPR